MPDSPDIAVLVLVIVPGLIGYGLYQTLTPTRQPTWTTRFVVAIVLSILSYLELLALEGWLTWLPDPVALSEAAARGGLEPILSPQPLLAVVAASLLVLPNALLLVWVHNLQLLHRFAARCHITAKTGFSSNWDDVLWNHRKNHWMLIQFEDGTAMTGWIIRHSDASEERSILLSDITQYDAQGEYFRWPHRDEKVFLANLNGIKFLRLIPVTETAYEQERQQPKDDPATANKG